MRGSGRIGNRELGLEFVDVGSRDLEVQVLHQRGADQLLQRLVLEQFPPGQVCHGFRVRLATRQDSA